MKRITFLHKLYQEGKLSEAEPSEEIKAAYLQKSGKSLSSAILQVFKATDKLAD